MTAPDQSFPGSSANYNSLAVWASKTQDDWQAEIRAPHEATYTNIFEGLFAGIQTGISFVTSILSHILNQFSQFVIRLAGLATTTFFATFDDIMNAVVSWTGRVFGLIGNNHVNQYPSVGTYEFGFDSSVKFVDIIMIGGGGGGGAANLFFTGQGGGCASWVTVTLERGVDFHQDATSFGVTVGAGGDPGGNGSPSKITYKDPSNTTRTITAPGGPYGGVGASHNPANPNPHSAGQGAPATSYRNLPYYGNSDVGYSTAGSVPGGGGGGGLGGGGGNGGHGRVWLVTRSANDR